MPWRKNCTYGDALENYRGCILNNYGENAIVVIDGYPEERTSKNERQDIHSVISRLRKTVCVTANDDTKSIKINLR